MGFKSPEFQSQFDPYSKWTDTAIHLRCYLNWVGNGTGNNRGSFCERTESCATRGALEETTCTYKEMRTKPNSHPLYYLQ